MTLIASTIATSVCDVCGHDVTKIWRRYKGNAYCSACYKREFKRAICPKCGMLSRLHKCNPDAVCIKCEHSGKPCIRCGKADYKIGKITEYGPVCNACSAYFREQKVCDGCGKPSQRLTHITRLGGDKLLCPACARSDHATCQACGRHRLLETLADGRKLCKKCLTLGETQCTNCGNMMPAGAGKICSSCYYSKLLLQRIEINCSAFVKQKVQEHFRFFAEWLVEEIGSKKTAITLNKYVKFFLEIEQTWEDMPQEYSILLKHFGPLRLRRCELPMRYLQSKGLATVDETAKQEEAERRRIAVIVGCKCKILTEFHLYLNKRLESGTTSLRSVRLALSPAAKLMQLVRDSGREKPIQKDLVTYLQKSPGQRAAISAFVGFLVYRYGLKMSLPITDGRAAKKKRQVLEAELSKLLKSDGKGILFQKKLLGTALAYFHGLPKNSISSQTLNELEKSSEGGFEVVIKGKAYWLPEEVWTSFK
jgi:hypothetical protein